MRILLVAVLCTLCGILVAAEEQPKPKRKPLEQEPGRFRGWGLLRWWPWRGREPEPGGLQWWGDGARGNEKEWQPPLVIEPEGGDAIGSIIWLHGMGDNGKGWATLLTKKVKNFRSA